MAEIHNFPKRDSIPRDLEDTSDLIDLCRLGLGPAEVFEAARASRKALDAEAIAFAIDALDRAEAAIQTARYLLEDFGGEIA